MKICKNCKNYTMLGLCSGARKNNSVDLISGVLIIKAKPPEQMRYYPAYCGVDGRWFQGKVEAK